MILSGNAHGLQAHRRQPQGVWVWNSPPCLSRGWGGGGGPECPAPTLSDSSGGESETLDPAQPTVSCPCPSAFALSQGPGQKPITALEEGWTSHPREKELESLAGRKAPRFVSLFGAAVCKRAGSAGRSPGSALRGRVRGDSLAGIQGLFLFLVPSKEAPTVLVCQRSRQLGVNRALCPLTLCSPRLRAEPVEAGACPQGGDAWLSPFPVGPALRETHQTTHQGIGSFPWNLHPTPSIF